MASSRIALPLILLTLAAALARPASVDGLDFPGGQAPPREPRLLAPGLINTGLVTRDVAMTPDGREFYFSQATAGYAQAAIMVTRLVDGRWTEPKVAPFSGRSGWTDLEPCISPDGTRFYFYSSRPAEPAGEPAQDLWVMDRQGPRWSEPRNLGAPVNTEAPEFFPSVARDGTLYFCRADPRTRVHTLYRARLTADGFATPELLPEEANTGRNRFNAWVSPEQDRLIVPVAGHPENRGGVDYWLILRDGQDRWSGPFNLGPGVNDGAGQSWSPYVSPDGGAFFFMSGRHSGPDRPWPAAWSGLQGRHNSPGSGRGAIYWMAADFLDEVATGQSPATEAATVAPVELPTGSEGPRKDWPDLAGPYLGQTPPGREPQLFAPGLVSTGLNERDIVISPDGRRILFGVMDLGLATVMETRLVGGRWSEPVTAAFHPDEDFACFEPALAADGASVLFLANRAAPGQEQGAGWANQNIFRSRLQGGVWTEPEALPAPVTSAAAEYFPSLAADGTLYFSREDSTGSPFLWAAEPDGEGFRAPVRLPAEVNIGTACYNAFVSPDESFIIACVAGDPRNLGPADYWISRRDGQGRWQPAINLGPPFNGPGQRAASAFVSPDGRYLFFSSSRQVPLDRTVLTRADLHRIHDGPGGGSSDIWWVGSEVLEGLD